MSKHSHTIREDILAETFSRYQRWLRNRQRPYLYDFKRDATWDFVKNPQDYYDPRRDYIFDNHDGTYGFRIQAEDSADQEIWIQGKFIAHTHTVVILEQRAYSIRDGLDRR